MASVYPAALKSFQYRQDFTQLVDAADVNVAYDEIGAIQSVLGTTPNTDSLDNGFQAWPTVKASISAARQGVTNPICLLIANDVQVPFGTTVYPSYTSKTWDTHNMWLGGNTVACPRTGWYQFTVYTRWHKDSLPADYQQPVFNRSGVIQSSIFIPSTASYLVSQGDFVSQGFQGSIRQTGTMGFPWFKGQTVGIELLQNVLTGTNLIGTTQLSISYMRTSPTTNNL